MFAKGRRPGRWFAAILISALTLALAACGDDADTPETDAGADAAADVAQGDAGETDAGETDAGETDAGSADAGGTDGGETDGGETDGGETDGGGDPDTIVDIAVADGRFNTLVTALEAAELAATLAGEGDFMVFAPTDDAFAALPDGTIDALLADVPTLTNILLYHVVDGAIASADIPAGETELEALNEGTLTVANVEGAITVNGIAVIDADLEASNGIVHAIEGVLLPPEPGNSIVDVASGDARFTTLIETLSAYPDLVELLDSDGAYTVFAPTNDAFAAIADVLPSLSEDEVRNILEYHVVVTGSLDAAAVLESAELQMANGAYAVVDADAVTIAGAPISETDIAADNGTIHAIDAVMLPPEDIPGVAAADERFSDLVQLLIDTNLVDTLAGEGPFTVFAPTNDAFVEAVDALELISGNVFLVERLLLSHVVAGRIFAAQLPEYTTLTAVSGVELTVEETPEGDFFVGGARVAVADVRASNGVVHGIESVIVPDDIVTVAEATGDFNTLLSFLEDTGLLGDLLLPNGPFTVFAPTDDAFAPSEKGVDIADFIPLLQYHVVAGALDSSTVLSSGMLQSIGGGAIFVDAEALTVGGAPLSEAIDIGTLNGYIHVMDGVLDIAGTIPTTASFLGGFETLLTALEAAELAAALAGPGPFTVFAPTDDAFAPLAEDGSLDALLSEPGLATLTDVLLYHVVSGALVNADAARAASGNDLTMMNEATLTVLVTDETISLSGLTSANVVVEDVPAANGLVHAIDAVLLPPDFVLPGAASVVDVALETEELSSLAETLGDFPELVELLSGDGDFTVFAPTNDAFAAASDVLGTLTAAEIRDVLLYHVVDGSVLDADAVLSSSLIRMANGVYASVDADAVSIAGAPISTPNVNAENGVVHIVDALMIPPRNIAEVAAEAGIFSSLLAALAGADLAATIAEGGPFTVFAPTNDAFAAAGEALASLGDNTELIARLLLSHVVSGDLTAEEVLAADALVSLSGVTLEVVNDDGDITVGRAGVAATDIPASNGIIHVLGSVITPPDIVATAVAGGFNDLVGALTATELADDVALPNGPFTVFAPTDAAFAAIADTLADLDLEATGEILLTHVVAGIYDSSAVLAETELTTLSGATIAVDAGALTVGGASLNAAGLDIYTLNGVIHVLDDVIVP